MSAIRPVDYIATEEGFKPADRQRWLHKKQYVLGKVYRMAPHEERSHAAHGGFFAMITAAWKTLPDEHAKRFTSAEHLRKYALIRCGHCDEHIFPFDTPESAEALLPVLRQFAGEYAVIKISENVVNIFTARSLRMTGDGALTEHEFKKVKRAVTDYCAGLIGVDAKTLEKQVNNAPPDELPSGAEESAASKAAPGGAADNQSQPAWVATYIDHLEQATGDPRSLNRRHDEAIAAIGGKPNERDLKIMRGIYRLRQKNMTGGLDRDQYHAELLKLGIEHPNKQGVDA